MVYVIQVYWQQDQDGTPSWSCSQAVSKPVWHVPLLCVQWKTPDDAHRNCPKHVEFYFKNKFEKLVHLVGCNIRIYHDARSPERHKKYTACTNLKAFITIEADVPCVHIFNALYYVTVSCAVLTVPTSSPFWRMDECLQFSVFVPLSRYSPCKGPAICLGNHSSCLNYRCPMCLL